MLRAVFQTPVGIPAVVLDLAEASTVEHHAGAAGAMVFQLHEAAAAVTLAEVGPGAGQNVRVQVDLHGCEVRASFSANGRRHSANTSPHAWQVRSSSLPLNRSMISLICLPRSTG